VIRLGDGSAVSMVKMPGSDGWAEARTPATRHSPSGLTEQRQLHSNWDDSVCEVLPYRQSIMILLYCTIST
jgi:hypothetical protein